MGTIVNVFTAIGFFSSFSVAAFAADWIIEFDGVTINCTQFLKKHRDNTLKGSDPMSEYWCIEAQKPENNVLNNELCSEHTSKTADYWSKGAAGLIRAGKKVVVQFENQQFVIGSLADQYAQLYCVGFYKFQSLPSSCISSEPRKQVQILIQRYRCSSLCKIRAGYAWCEPGS